MPEKEIKQPGSEGQIQMASVVILEMRILRQKEHGSTGSQHNLQPCVAADDAVAHSSKVLLVRPFYSVLLMSVSESVYLLKAALNEIDEMNINRVQLCFQSGSAMSHIWDTISICITKTN